MAIVSTFNEQCGIAGYTRMLLTQLEGAFDITVFDLDQSLMRATDGHLLKAADAQVKDFAAAFGTFDIVNIQLEYGTLGALPDDIVRRFQALVAAAPALSVTFHTILPTPRFPADRFREQFFRFELWNSYVTVRDHLRAKRYRASIYDCLRHQQKTKPLCVIVHTPRDAKHMRLAEGFAKVWDHPLAFLTADKAKALGGPQGPRPLAGLPQGPKNRVLIGVFGFVSAYKGIHTAIKALPLLPDNYELAIFGGLHPGEIRPGDYGGPSDMHPYLGTLLDEVGVTKTTKPPAGVPGAMPLEKDRAPKTRPMHERVHFMGVLDDDALAAAMGAVDVAVLPYFETGQASSGPMSIATEMGAKVVASRIQAFMQYATYHPGRITFFDAGNFLELAQRIAAVAKTPPATASAAYDAATNRALYVAAHRALLGQTIDAPNAAEG